MNAYFKRIELFLQALLCGLLLWGLQAVQVHPDRDDMASMILLSGHLDEYNRYLDGDTLDGPWQKAAYWQQWFRDTAPVQQVVKDLKGYDVHPPLYFMLVAALNQWVQHTEMSLLLLQCLLWVLSLVVMRSAARHWGLTGHGQRILTWLIVVSPWCLACFAEYRHYSLLFLETALLLIIYPIRDQKFHIWQLLPWALVWLAAFLTHYGALFFALSTVILLFLQRPPGWKWYVIAVGAAFLIFLLLWPSGLDALLHGDNGEAFSLFRGLKTLPALLGSMFPVWGAFMWGNTLLKLLAVLLGFLLLFMLRDRVYRPADPIWIGLGFALVYSLLGISGKIPDHAMGGKYLALAYPALLLAISQRMEHWDSRKWIRLLLLAFLCSIALEIKVRRQEQTIINAMTHSRRFIANYPDMFNAFRLVYVLPPDMPVYMGNSGLPIPVYEPGDCIWLDQQRENMPIPMEAKPLKLRSVHVQGWLYEPVFPGH